MAGHITAWPHTSCTKHSPNAKDCYLSYYQLPSQPLLSLGMKPYPLSSCLPGELLRRAHSLLSLLTILFLCTYYCVCHTHTHTERARLASTIPASILPSPHQHTHCTRLEDTIVKSWFGTKDTVLASRSPKVPKTSRVSKPKAPSFVLTTPSLHYYGPPQSPKP